MLEWYEDDLQTTVVLDSTSSVSVVRSVHQPVRLGCIWGEPGFWETALALTMHLIPTFILLAVLALSWRWEWIGGILFSALGLFYVISFWGRFPWSTYAIISGPLFALGVLFLFNWRYHSQLHRSRETIAQ